MEVPFLGLASESPALALVRSFLPTTGPWTNEMRSFLLFTVPDRCLTESPAGATCGPESRR
jgi:hypothetical protein